MFKDVFHHFVKHFLNLVLIYVFWHILWNTKMDHVGPPVASQVVPHAYGGPPVRPPQSTPGTDRQEDPAPH